MWEVQRRHVLRSSSVLFGYGSEGEGRATEKTQITKQNKGMTEIERRVMARERETWGGGENGVIGGGGEGEVGNSNCLGRRDFNGRIEKHLHLFRYFSMAKARVAGEKGSGHVGQVNI
jgi:hypothetical protein